MMMPAVMTPQKIDSSARVLGIFSSVAISAPDHAPVPGSGTATNRYSPRRAYFVTSPLLLSSFFLYAAANLRSGGRVSAHASSFSPNTSSSGMGSILPRMASGKSVVHGIPAAAPSGTAPRSSTSGTMEMIKTAASRPAPRSQSNNAENNLLLLFFEILLLFYPLSTENARALL